MKGYRPHYPRKDKAKPKLSLNLKESKRDWTISSEIKSYFIKFLEKSVSTGAEVYVYVPVAREIFNDSWLKNVKLITNDTGAKLIDFSSDYSLIDNTEVWKDNVHLYDEGAVILTDKIINILIKDSIL